MAYDDRNVTLEGVTLIYRNFKGRPGQFNAEGDRNFGVILDEKLARMMMQDGWTIRELAPLEEGDSPKYMLKVKLKYRNREGKEVNRPPRVVLITSRGRTNLTESEVETLDIANIENADLIVRPFEWTMGKGKDERSGINAYLQSLYVTIREDALELKYAEVGAVQEKHEDGPQFQ